MEYNYLKSFKFTMTGRGKRLEICLHLWKLKKRKLNVNVKKGKKKNTELNLQRLLREKISQFRRSSRNYNKKSKQKKPKIYQKISNKKLKQSVFVYRKSKLPRSKPQLSKNELHSKKKNQKDRELLRGHIRLTKELLKQNEWLNQN